MTIDMTHVREYNGTATPRTLAASTFYQYDALDRLNRVTDANGNVTTMGFDSLGRKTSMIDPDMGTWSYDYYANGSLKWQLDAKNQKLWFGYDALDRLTTTWRDGSWQPLTTYAYDAAAVPNSKGRRTSAATHTTTGATQTFQTWTYDQRGRVKSMGQSALGTVLSLEFTYNSADQQTTVTYGNTGEVVSYAYDAALRPYQACTNLGGCFITQATYTPLDQPKEWRMGGTLVQSWEYEPLTRRLSQLTVGSTNAPQSHLNRGYGYDVGGNVTTIANNTIGQTENFTYAGLSL